MSSRERKPSNQWYQEDKDLTIMDPDGWDRSNYEYSFYEEEVTKEEYQRRVMASTVIFRALNADKETKDGTTE